MMQNKDFIDPGTSGRLKVLLQRMTEVEDVVTAGRIDEVMDSDSPVTQFALRLLGAQAAGQVSKATGVGTIRKKKKKKKTGPFGGCFFFFFFFFIKSRKIKLIRVWGEVGVKR